MGKFHVLGHVVVVGLAFLLQGCASLYLHSDAMEAATKAAKDDLTKVNIDNTFSDAKARLDAFAIDEEAGVAAYHVASRNRDVANLVRRNPLDSSGQAPTAALSGLVLTRTGVILGRPSAGGRTIATKLADARLADLPDSIELTQEGIDVNRRTYLSALKAFTAAAEDKDPRPTDCDKTPPSAPQPTTTSSEADVAYVRIVRACAEIKTQTAKLARDKAILEPGEGSQLATVAEESKEAAALIVAQTAEAGRIEGAIKNLKKKPPSNQKEFEDEIKKIRDWLDKAKGIAAAAGAEEISSVLEDLLAADLSAKLATGETPSTLTVGTLAVLKLTTALAQASDAFSSQSQVFRVNSTLLAIAEQQQKLDMAKLTVEQQRVNQHILGAQELALIREVALLSATQRIAARTLGGATLSDGFASVGAGNNPARQGAGAALAAYVDSWNQGRIPYHVLEFRKVQVERAYIVQRASKTAKNWSAVLSPPLDDLVAYGKGGIRPETIATIITNLGIMGAILAK